MSNTTTAPVNLALLPAFVAPLVAARLGVESPGHVSTLPATGRPDCLTENGSGTCNHDDHDGYGVGE